MKNQRLAPLSGIAFVVLLLVGFIPVGGDTPDLDASGSSVVTYYANHQGSQIAAAILVALAALFLAIFTASLRERLRGSGGRSELWSTVVLIGGGAAVAGFLVAVGVHVALTDGGDKNLPADAMVALNALDNDDFFAFAIPIGIMLFGAAGAILGAGALPRWLGWVALVLGIFFFTPIGFVAGLLALIWIIVVSVLMYRSPAPA
jgi:hypothetical protein